MKPFNITEALAHPERVVHKDGPRAVQVAHFPDAYYDSRVVILWEKGKSVCKYTEDGFGYLGSVTPVVLLSTPPERVPFTVEDFKKGWEVVYRNGEKPIEVKVFEKMTNSQPVGSLTEKQVFTWHCADGSFWNGKEKHALDLFLLKPATT